MAEPFKNRFNPLVVQSMASNLHRVHAGFNIQGFVRMACTGLELLELKARSHHICDALVRYLPSEFPLAAEIIVSSLHPDDAAALADQGLSPRGIRGWAIMPLAEFVARQGLSHFDLAMQVLRQLTCRFTAEFSIRAFILYDQKSALTAMRAFAKDGNYHVRRLASEGARPRLPWGQQLPELMANPAPLWPIINLLKNDTHEYVRKSVANNLNDIAKDHPEKVNNVIAKWLPKADKNLQKLLKHGCRTLIKNGNLDTLALFGFNTAEICIESMQLSTDSLSVGEQLQLSLRLRSVAQRQQAIMLDYVVYHQKANGRLSPKVFKWSSFVLAAGETRSLQKVHSFKRVTTRTYHPGDHRIAVQLNGKEYSGIVFELSTDLPDA